MATTFADRLQEGIGVAEKLAGNVIEALPPDAADRIEARVTQIVRGARRRWERASDVRDEARIAIKRHPFAATALAFGLGALLGAAAGRLAGACARDAASRRATPRDDGDIEC